MSKIVATGTVFFSIFEISSFFWGGGGGAKMDKILLPKNKIKKIK